MFFVEAPPYVCNNILFIGRPPTTRGSILKAHQRKSTSINDLRDGPVFIPSPATSKKYTQRTPNMDMFRPKDLRFEPLGWFELLLSRGATSVMKLLARRERKVSPAGAAIASPPVPAELP